MQYVILTFVLTKWINDESINWKHWIDWINWINEYMNKRILTFQRYWWVANILFWLYNVCTEAFYIRLYIFTFNTSIFDEKIEAFPDNKAFVSIFTPSVRTFKSWLDAESILLTFITLSFLERWFSAGSTIYLSDLSFNWMTWRQYFTTTLVHWRTFQS